jgi:hypothetical protein
VCYEFWIIPRDPRATGRFRRIVHVTPCVTPHVTPCVTPRVDAGTCAEAVCAVRPRIQALEPPSQVSSVSGLRAKAAVPRLRQDDLARFDDVYEVSTATTHGSSESELEGRPNSTRTRLCVREGAGPSESAHQLTPRLRAHSRHGGGAWTPSLARRERPPSQRHSVRQSSGEPRALGQAAATWLSR